MLNNFFNCSMLCCQTGAAVIYRGSTPSLEFTTPFNANEVLYVDINFEQQGKPVFSVGGTVEDKKVTVTLTAEQTELFNEGGLPQAVVQLKVTLNDGGIAYSNIVPFWASRVIEVGEGE